MFIISQQDLTVNNGMHDAVSGLLQATRTSGKVMNQLGHCWTHCVWVQHEHISLHTLTKQPTIMKPPSRRGIIGDLQNNFYILGEGQQVRMSSGDQKSLVIDKSKKGSQYQKAKVKEITLRHLHSNNDH